MTQLEWHYTLTQHATDRMTLERFASELQGGAAVGVGQGQQPGPFVSLEGWPLEGAPGDGG